MPSRIAARSTTAGTPVKSCSSTRAGVKAISFCAFGRHVPAGQRLDVLGIDEPRVLAAQQVLEQDLQRVRQARNVREAGLLERRQAEDVKRLAPDGERGARVERILRGHLKIIVYKR